MSNRTELGLGLLGAAVVLGVLGDALLRATPWGINVLVWTVALAAAVAILVRWRRLPVTGDRRMLALPLLFFAAAFAWRDSLTLQCLDGLAILVTLALAVLRTRSGHLLLASVAEYLWGVVLLWLHAAAGLAPLLFGDIQWDKIPRGRAYSGLMAVGRGLVVAVPLLLLFGSLFASADAVFQKGVTEFFDWDIDTALSHVLLAASCAWLVGGALRALLLAREWKEPLGDHPLGVSMGIVEIGTVLGLLNALFLAFVLVQVRYFFGGEALVLATTGLTYAEYARRGFFELVWVSALVLPMLLGAHGLLRKESSTHERVFGALAGALVALLFVIMVSAVQRMRLYQETYGLTELRVYTTAFMAWLAVLFVWFLATVLRGRRERFAFGALVSGFLAIALLNVLNPDALIARTNVSQQRAAHAFDAGYVTSLSADAVPALVAALPALPETQRAAVAVRLLARWPNLTNRDWRTWNHGRVQAWEAIEANKGALQEMMHPAQ